jgi:glycosyltransferase involved in cell wall biosynthesis
MTDTQQTGAPPRIEGGWRLKGAKRVARPGTPLISIIVVVRNGAGTIEACIRSVVDQAYDNVELVIVDGVSSDGTLDIIRRYDERIAYWTSGRDRGIFDAMNKATRLITGDWVLFLGCDDRLLIDLREIAARLTDASTIYYGDAFWPKANRRYDGLFSAAKLARTNICHQAMFYPGAVFSRYEYNLRYATQADWELNMRCFSDPGFRFQYLPLLVAHYNDVDGNSARNRDLPLETDYVRLVRRHFPLRIFLWRAAIAYGGRLLRLLGLKR